MPSNADYVRSQYERGRVRREVMTVIEHGRRSRLSIARFTQERGAASSFHKVVETLDTVLKSRGMLVSDERKRRRMVKTLGFCLRVLAVACFDYVGSLSRILPCQVPSVDLPKSSPSASDLTTLSFHLPEHCNLRTPYSPNLNSAARTGI